MSFKEYEDPEELKKMQRVTAYALREFDRVCKALDLRYVVWAGTCIGAVRHHGFIPWDDDVDVAMCRSDYDRFLREAPKVLKKDFTIENARNTDYFPIPFSYLSIKGTVNVPYFFQGCKWERGIGIDIFPLDTVSENLSIRRRQLLRTWFWGRLGILSATSRPYLPFDGVKKKLVYFACSIVHFFLNLFHVSTALIQKKWESAAMLASNENPVIVADFSDRSPMNWSARIDELFPANDGPFENFSVKIPYQYDTLLTREYGSYMELPPYEQRKNHYPVKLDFGNY